MANKKVVLDAGHGFNTSGKRSPASMGTVVREWTLNNAVCNYIQEILKNYNVTVVRVDDTTGKTDVPLSTRVAKTNAQKPNLFVSIHHNAGGGTGVETYWHTYGSTADKKVAQIIQSNLVKRTGMRNRGVKQASFAVLNCKSSIPAVLVEGGFYDNHADFDYITTIKGQKAYAQAVADSIIQYLGLTKKTPTTTTNSYLVRITVDSLNVRKSPTISSAIVTTVKKGGVYTIVEVSNGWGKLKSNIGWISLDCTEKVK